MKFACLTVLLCSLFVYLGLWQLQRKDHKQNLELQHKLAMQSTPITLKELHNVLAKAKLNASTFASSSMSSTMVSSMASSAIASLLYHPLVIEGQFLSEKNILIDNQILRGQPGYRILTPFKTHGHETLILIDRGFVPWGPTRKNLPVIIAIGPKARDTAEDNNSSLGENSNKFVSLTGMITTLSQGILLKEDQQGAEAEAMATDLPWPLRVQKLDYAKLEAKLGSPIYPFLLQLPVESPYTFQHMPFSLGLSADRHLGYAVQWFTMAIGVVLYYVFTHMRRREKSE
jgi:surfeit locus 1 family protein